jgi:hypothetical protein
MKILKQLLASIASTENCPVEKNDTTIVLECEYVLPADLKYCLGNYNSVILFENAECPIKILGSKDFASANRIVIGEDIENDISHDWFVIASNDRLQYITIDLAHERSGRCYDSFWDRHGVAGEQPIIANSFTELLQALYDNKGKYPYWLRDDFKSLGDAYDD